MFFAKLRSGDETCIALFRRYLQDEDYREIVRLVSGHSILCRIAFRLIPGHYADHAAVIGAGLIRIREFLDHPEMD